MLKWCILIFSRQYYPCLVKTAPYMYRSQNLIGMILHVIHAPVPCKTFYIIKNKQPNQLSARFFNFRI